MRKLVAAVFGLAALSCLSAQADDFSVSSLPGLQWWASAADSTLGQNPDASGTVSNGSPVGFISDLSGNGRNAVMGNAITSGSDAFRPTYQSNLVGFEPGILYNGSTAFSSLQRAFFNGTSAGTIAIAVEADSFDDSKRYLLGGGNASLGFGNLGVPSTSFLEGNNSSPTLYGSTVATLNGSQGAYDTEILIARYQAGGSLSLWANGVLAGTLPVSSIGPSSTLSPTIPLLGDSNYSISSTGLTAPTSTAGNFYFLEGMATNTALSNSQITQLYNYLSEKWTGIQPVALSPNLDWSSTINPQESAASTIPTAGHIEGVASGNNQRFIFHTAVIADYDTNWNLLTSNQAIGAGIYPSGSPVHSGDGDYAAGKLFAPLENDLAGSGATIAVYNAAEPGLPFVTYKTLTGPQHECSGLAVVPTAGTDGIIFVTSNYANEGGSQLWMYNYADGNVSSPNFGAYLGNLQIPSGISGIQGVAYKAPYFYFSGTGMDRVLYQNGVLGNQAQVMWQSSNTFQGLTVEGSNILQVLQGGATNATVETLSGDGFTQMNPTGFNAWNVNGPSNFGSSSAWNTSIPNAPGAAVLFGNGAGTWVHADSVPVTIDNAYTLGSLSFDTTAGTSYSLVSDGQPGHGITLNSGNGSGALIGVYSGNHSIGADLAIADAGGLTFDVVSGSTLTVNGAISESGGSRSITLADNGSLILGNTNSYSGGTTVRFGSLVTTGKGSLGSGPLTINASTGSTSSVTIGGTESIGGLFGTVQQTGNATLTINPGAALTVNQQSVSSFPGVLANSGTFATAGNGTLELDAAPTLGSNSSIQVGGNSTLRFNVSAGSATVAAGATASVATSATLQLAGSVSALSSGSTAVNIMNNGSAASGGGFLVTGSGQSVGTVNGSTNSDANGATIYGGDTVVGDGIHSANLTATQILQNTLTINAGSSVTIVPSGNAVANDYAPQSLTGVATTLSTADDSATSTSATTASDMTDAGIGSSPSAADALTEIQDAIESDVISQATGQHMEKRLLAIEHLAAIESGVDMSFRINNLLSQLPSSSHSSTDSPTLENGFASLSMANSEITSFGGAVNDASPTVVPEPPTLPLATLGTLLAGATATRGMRRRGRARAA
jgi:autotransporter-associated beta strand protein